MKSALSNWIKCGLYLAAWGAVVLISALKKPTALPLAVAFPFGIVGLLPSDNAIMIIMLAGPGVIICGWTIYFALTIGIFVTRRNALSYAIYILFCILLVLNLVGCDRLIEIASHIE